MLSFQTLIEWVTQGIEVLAIVIMVAFISVGTVRWLLQSRKQFEHAYQSYRILLGKSLLVGLELLVAADIIRTVTLELTLMNLATLALLVLVRTALGWALTLEVEGRWPWQERKETVPETES
jgi:uncharacterized membrane protein